MFELVYSVENYKYRIKQALGVIDFPILLRLIKVIEERYFPRNCKLGAIDLNTWLSLTRISNYTKY